MRLAIALGIAACAAAAACEVSVSTSTTVNSKEMEAVIESSMAESGLVGAKVTCPTAIDGKKGSTFNCDLAVEGKTYALVVTIKNLGGADLKRAKVNVDLEFRFAQGAVFFLRSKLIEAVTPSVKEKTGVDPVIDCGSDPLLFATDDAILCDISAEGKRAKIRITVKGDEITGWKIE